MKRDYTHERRIERLECLLANMQIEMACLRLEATKEKPAPRPWWKRLMGIDQ